MSECSKLGEVEYWDQVYFNDPNIRGQNLQIAESYLKNLPGTKQDELLRDCRQFVEMACGLGYISSLIADNYPKIKKITALDISGEAIRLAKALNPRPNIEYIQKDMRTFSDIYSRENEVIFAGNVIEHYFESYLWLDTFLFHSQYTIILIPWNEPNVWPIHEGHSHHCRVFDDDSFERYEIIEEWKFDSPGWNKPPSRQWAILFKGNL